MASAPNVTSAAPTPTAVPRKSRWRWYILGFLLLVVATPVAWYFIAGWLGERAMAELLAEIDAEDPSWRWADVVGKMEPIPDEANSVAQIVKVRALARTPGTFNPGSKWDNAEPLQNARLTDDQVNALQTAFSRCDPTLRDEARKLKDLPRGRFSISAQGNPFDFDYEELQISRTVVYVLQIDAALRAHEGDLDGAAESCEAILNTAGAFKDHPLLIGYLVRVAEQAIAIHAIERVLGQGTVSEPHLKKLQELLQREADTDGLYPAIRGERAASHQMYANIRDGKMAISQMFGGMKGATTDEAVTGRLLDVFPNVILKDYPDYLRTMNANVRACKLEPELRAGELEKIDQSVRTDGNMLSRMLLPGIVKVAEASRRTQANLRCAIVAVAAERYRLSKGAWPRTLDELVKDGLLAKVPTDPYDGKPLRWKRTPTGAVAYSVGRGAACRRRSRTSNPAACGLAFAWRLANAKPQAAHRSTGVSMRRLLIGVLAALASASVAFAQDAKRLDRHGEPLPAEAVLCDPLTDAIKCKIASLIPPAKQRPYGAFFSHDAKTYVHVDEGSISLIDTASGKEKDSLAPPGRRPCAPSRCWRRFRARRRPRRCKPSRGKTRIIR